MKLKKFKALKVGDKVQMRTWKELLALKNIRTSGDSPKKIHIMDEKTAYTVWTLTDLDDMYGEEFTITAVDEDGTVELSNEFWTVRKALK